MSAPPNAWKKPLVFKTRDPPTKEETKHKEQEAPKELTELPSVITASLLNDASPVLSIPPSPLLEPLSDTDTLSSVVNQLNLNEASTRRTSNHDVILTSSSSTTKPPLKSWSQLFNKPNKSMTQTTPDTTVSNVSNVANPKSPVKSKSKSPISPKQTAIESEFSSISLQDNPLISAALSHPFPEPLRARGLVNRSNFCYLNAVLQPLIHCPPFVRWMQQASKVVSMRWRQHVPLLEALVSFCSEFQVDQTDDSNGLDDPFVPNMLFDALQRVGHDDMVKGSQEDAEEFLGYLLNALHEEILKYVRFRDQSTPTSTRMTTPDNEWLEVGQKNRTSVTRHAEQEQTSITALFGGQFRSTVSALGAKDSVVLEPFLFLQLDIRAPEIQSIGDALQHLTQPEVIDSVHRHGQSVSATKRIQFEKLPPVLIIHLKRFHYDSVAGVQKLDRVITFPRRLVLTGSLLSTTLSRTVSPAFYYRLFAVVSHHGKDASLGHYTCDVWQRHRRRWLRIDDAVLMPVRRRHVFHHVTNSLTGETPYLLWYEQCTAEETEEDDDDVVDDSSTVASGRQTPIGRMTPRVLSRQVSRELITNVTRNKMKSASNNNALHTAAPKPPVMPSARGREEMDSVVSTPTKSAIPGAVYVETRTDTTEERRPPTASSVVTPAPLPPSEEWQPVANRRHRSRRGH